MKNMKLGYKQTFKHFIHSDVDLIIRNNNKETKNNN